MNQDLTMHSVERPAKKSSRTVIARLGSGRYNNFHILIDILQGVSREVFLDIMIDFRYADVFVRYKPLLWIRKVYPALWMDVDGPSRRYSPASAQFCHIISGVIRKIQQTAGKQIVMTYIEGTKESRLGEATSGSVMLRVVRTQFMSL